MTNSDLAHDYYIRAKNRLEAVKLLYSLKSYPDVVRESQEVFELLLKGYLRLLKIDPPKWHDVGQILIENADKLSDELNKNIHAIVSFSKYLRKERENAFYGDEDLIPMFSFTDIEAKACIDQLETFFVIFDKEFS